MPAASLELTLERFEYSRVGEDWAVLRLLARLGSELGAPAQAQLVVRRGQDPPTPLPARACALERRLLAGSRRGAGRRSSELIWRASFAVPLAVIECRYTVFELTADHGLALALPAPGARIVVPRQLALAPIRRVRVQRPGIAVGHVRHRFAALATAVAVGATSSPVAALAAGGAANTPSGATVPNGPGNAPAGATAARSAAPGGGPNPAAPSPPPSSSAGPSLPTSRAGATVSAAGDPKPATRAATPSSTGTTRTPAVFTPAASSASRSTHRQASSSNPAPAPNAAATHPAVTHLSSVAAQPPRPDPRPLIPGTRCGSHTGAAGLPIVAVAAVAATKLSHHPRPAARSRCTSATTRKPGKRHHRSKPDRRPGATLVITGASSRPGTHHRTSAARKRPSGGAAEQPLRPGAQAPPVKLGSPPVGSPPVDSPPAGSTSNSVSTLSSAPSGFLAPRAWTGTVMANPALTGAVSDLSGLLSNGNRPPSFLIPIYMQAGRRYDVPWEVLAAINAIESDYGRNLNTSSAGAVGWMQFEPATWREWGVAADGHRVANPYDPRDAIFSAARYLAAAGAKQDIAKAVFAYNHAQWYVDEVLSRAQAITQHAQYVRSTLKHGVFSVYFATGVKRHPTVRYTGSVMSHYDRLIASANMVSAANFPYLYAGGHEQPAKFEPFDCSGSVSYVVQQAGYRVPTTASGGIPTWKFPAGPGRVTIFYNPGHTFMRIGGRFFGTSGFARPGGGAGWFNVDKLSAGYLATFQEVHIPRLGPNSFAPSTHRR